MIDFEVSVLIKTELNKLQFFAILINDTFIYYTLPDEEEDDDDSEEVEIPHLNDSMEIPENDTGGGLGDDDEGFEDAEDFKDAEDHESKTSVPNVATAFSTQYRFY